MVSEEERLMKEERLKEEFDELREEYRKRFGFPYPNRMNAFEGFERAIENIKRSLETGEPYKPPKFNWSEDKVY